jgi:predicted alpha/beta-hydrolase family hydrolase
VEARRAGPLIDHTPAMLPWEEAVKAAGLFERSVATLRYQFPYMEKGAKRMEKGAKRLDAPATAYATVRAAVAEASSRCPELPLIAGGKSFKRGSVWLRKWTVENLAPAARWLLVVPNKFYIPRVGDRIPCVHAVTEERYSVEGCAQKNCRGHSLQ